MAEPLLKNDQLAYLEQLANSAPSDALRRRALILLLYNQGKNTAEISALVGITSRSVRHWRAEFQKHGMKIFPRTGAEPGAAGPSYRSDQKTGACFAPAGCDALSADAEEAGYKTR